jgi:hypothetical protein
MNLKEEVQVPTERNVAALQDAGAQWNAGDLEGCLALYDLEAVRHGYAGVQEPVLRQLGAFPPR